MNFSSFLNQRRRTTTNKAEVHWKRETKMKVADGILGMTLALAFGGPCAWPQVASAVQKSGPTSFKTFYLTNNADTHAALDITTALRNMLDPSVKIYLVPEQNAIVMNAPPDQILLAQNLLNDLDKPKKTYRLVYTITDIDGGKRVGTQHFAIIVVAGGRTTLKQGSRVPVSTGEVDLGGTHKMQATYLDVGLNVDASLDESVDGLRLRTKVEQSSVATETSGLGAQDPIVRQTVMEGTSILTQGKPLVLGSLDIPGTTRHLDVEVVLELVR